MLENSKEEQMEYISNFIKNYNIEENIFGIKPDTKVYRVISIKRLFELFNTKKLVLVKPEKWDDPFENFLSKTTLISGSEKIGFRITNNFYGQCWTQKRECDGIWRNYASLDSGAKIQTTVEKLLKVIFDKSNNFSNISCFIGKVKYMSDRKIKDFISGKDFLQWVEDTSGKNPAKTLLIKRAEFSYEREVRVLFAGNEEKFKDKDIVSFDINPNDFIESIVFAPNTDTNMLDVYKKALLNFGFSGNKISKSELYKPLELRVKTDAGL